MDDCPLPHYHIWDKHGASFCECIIYYTLLDDLRARKRNNTRPGVLLPPEGDFDGCIHVSNQIQKDEDLSAGTFFWKLNTTESISICTSFHLWESHCQLEILEVEDKNQCHLNDLR